MDLVSIKTFLECDNAFLLELIEQFETETQRCSNEFVEFMDAADLDSIRRTAHRLLSSSAILGFSELSETLKAIEKCKEWNNQEINALLEEYRKALRNCRSSIDTAKQELAKSD